MTETITCDSGRGFFWCEVDSTFQSLFIHQSQVKDRRLFHVNDRVRFDIEPNPRRPGEMQGVRAEWVGFVARQASASITGDRQ